MPFEECCWWDRGHRRGQVAEERRLFKSSPWGLRAVLPVLPLLSCCSESLVWTPLPPRLAARASCPAWKLSTATGLINCGCFWASVWPAPNHISALGFVMEKGVPVSGGAARGTGSMDGQPEVPRAVVGSKRGCARPQHFMVPHVQNGEPCLLFITLPHTVQ